jgi:hypothetical protein
LNLRPPGPSRIRCRVAFADSLRGRRLLATDLANDHQIVALLSWHFESSGRGRSGRPHLTSAAVWNGAGAAL